jgi:hypothetical protein
MEGGLPALSGSLAGGLLYVLTHLGGPLPQVPVVVVLAACRAACSGSRQVRRLDRCKRSRENPGWWPCRSR